MIKVFICLLIGAIALVQPASGQVQLKLHEQTQSLASKNYEVKEVVDNRPARESAGLVSQQKNGNKAPAVFDNSLEADVRDFYNRKLTGGKNLIIEVRRLLLSEDYEASRLKSVCDLHLVFYLVEDSAIFRVYSTERKAERFGNVPAVHRRNLAEALISCFNELEYINLDYKQAFVKLDSVPKIEENKVLPSPVNLRVVKDSVLRRGIYYSHKDFFSNSPDTATLFYTEELTYGSKHLKDQPNFKPRAVKGGRRIDCWGFSDGKVAYVHYQGNYFPIQISKEALTFTGIENTSTSGGAYASAAILGGLVGVGAVAVVDALSGASNLNSYAIHPELGTIYFIGPAKPDE